jgi:regulator of replication initiation timing
LRLSTGVFAIANYCKLFFLQVSFFSCIFATENSKQIVKMLISLQILTDREWFLLLIGAVTYITLFVLTVQNSRRKVLDLQERLNKVRAMQEEQQSTSREGIEQNRQRITELEALIRKLGDENSVLRLELEEKKTRLDYANRMAEIETEKREQAESVIFGSDIYATMQRMLDRGECMGNDEWRRLEQVVNSVYTGFTERLYNLYRMTDQDYHVSLLIKVRIPMKDIALLTAHSKESVASTRSRLYQKVFGRKGSSKDWDDFVLSI